MAVFSVKQHAFIRNGVSNEAQQPLAARKHFGRLHDDAEGQQPAIEERVKRARLLARRDAFRQVHDHEQVQVAALARLAARGRAEEVECLRLAGLYDAVSDALNQRVT